MSKLQRVFITPMQQENVKHNYILSSPSDAIGSIVISSGQVKIVVVKQEHPQRGEVQLTGFGRPHARPRNSFLQLLLDQLGLFAGGLIGLAGCLLIWLVVWLLGSGFEYFANITSPPRTQCAGVAFGIPCLPEAPGRPVRSARFEIKFGPEAAATAINFVITDARISLHVVKELPVDVALLGIRVTKGVSSQLSNLQRLPPLVFQGAVDMLVGPIEKKDHFTTQIVLSEYAIKSVETLFDGSARGPPKQNELATVLDVYIVGSLTGYYGPDQHGESIHNARIIDLGARPDEWKQYQKDVKEWRSELAKATEFPETFYENASNDAEALHRAAEGHAYKMQNPAYSRRIEQPSERSEENRPAKRIRGIR